MKKKVGVYKLKGGGYQISYVDRHGIRRRRYFESLTEANAQAYAVQNNFSKPLLIGSELPVSLHLEDYFKGHPAATIKQRGKFILKSFLETFGKMPIGELEKLQLDQWLIKIKAEKKYSSASMLQAKYAFTPFFNWLVANNVIERNYLAEIKVKRGTRVKEKLYLSEPELKAILDKLKSISLELTYPVTYFLVHTGCKINEALSLSWHQIDFEKNTAYFPPKPCSDERTINLHPKLMELLKTQPMISGAVFNDENNKVWTLSKYRKKLARDRSHVGLERLWDNFSFRHSFAYHFLRKGGTLPQLQVILGHRNIGDTLDAYGSIVSKDAEKTSPYA